MAGLEIKSEDVIRLIQQFLKENNLQRTLQSLQDETSITLNAAESTETLRQDILAGRWDAVLHTTRGLTLSNRAQMLLYDQIVGELIENGDRSAARILLRQSDALMRLRDADLDRRTVPTARPSGAMPWCTRCAATSAPSPARLVTLLGQALRWQQEHEYLAATPDTGYDLFQGEIPTLQHTEDVVPGHGYATLQFPPKQFAEAVAFAPNGQLLATGSSDGFIEIWNPMTGKLRKDLQYQAQDKMMGMDAAILCLAFSRDSDLLASGAQDGKIKVWKVATGTCVRRFPSAHAQGVTCVALTKDASQVLSGGFDGMVRLHGMKSGKMLKEYRGHTSFVNAVLFSTDYTRIFSGSSDGSVKIWETKSGDCMTTVSPTNSLSITALHAIPGTGLILVGSQSKKVVAMDARGRTVWDATLSKEMNIPNQTPGEPVGYAVSPYGQYVYVVSDHGTLVAISTKSKQAVAMVRTVEKAIGLCAHPGANVVAVWTESGEVALWRA
ncbi:hypothetical protein AMAG_01879 [Allomyces macrogynus ATCC 38327]|uniref:WD40 repeat-containing protein SMU1 n=1 Tax=Allomyces macrogynus (strain ATCC 38327) TaxID=578462 RepID=A0A0L0S0V8_ALLM3|nr:hypothetical protein AMAG_01879 [Allomyces macrogynus ATCC 38327]|eukprot:KNE56035.1 hypothetical protein AMAG_01879 [Allomyces macrogynus ATCC 38327]